MSLTPATIRQRYPQFSDKGVFDDGVIQPYIDFATAMLNASRWGTQLDFATSLYVAHYLTLVARDGLVNLVGGIPGEVSGPMQSKSVDKVVVSYDTKAVTAENGSFWNLTTYGVQLFRLAMMFGAGGIQIC